jgi:glycine oxidase
MRSVDVIVIGQGLAGATLAWQLRRRGQRVVVIDREAATSSSRIAAGLITPVTGKRLAKSWRWNELYPAAVAFYRAIEDKTGASILHQKASVRLFADEAERDEYQKRAAGMLAGLVRDAEINRDWLLAPFGGFEMPEAARLDVLRYLDVSRDLFRQDDGYARADVDPGRDLELLADGVRIRRLNLEARTLVFCRGFTPDRDPWFGSIRFNAAKGEILTLRIPGLAEDRVVHRGIWLAPVGGDVFRAGSTYEWHDLTSTPTAVGRAEIESRLRAFLRLPVEVIDHRAAVRPVIDAGFPMLGRHPQWPQLAYFNGLGSKGSLLAPFCAEQLAACLAGERAPEAEVDVRKALGK